MNSKERDSHNQPAKKTVWYSNFVENMRRFFIYLRELGKEIEPWHALAWALGTIAAIVVVLVYQVPWAAIPAFVVLALATILLLEGLFLLLRRLFSDSRRSPSSPLNNVHNELLDAYQRGDLSLLIMSQFVLRIILVIYVVIATVPLIGTSSHGFMLEIYRAELLIIALYLLVSSFYFRHGLKKNREALLQNSSERISGILWPPAVVDWMVIVFLSSSHLGPDSYHLAFIIPVLGAWLFSQTGRGELLFKLILAGILIEYIILCSVFTISPKTRAALNLAWTQLPAFLAVNLLPKLIFWSAAALPLALLKKVRMMESAKRREAELKSQMLNAVTEHIVYSVFRKDKDRKFEFVNGPMLQRLGRTREEVIGKSDKEIGIDRPEYCQSDYAVLNALNAEEAMFQGLEPNFEQGRAEEIIFTTKKGITDATGKIIGLVGVCEPGIPMQVQRMYEKILDCLPYYVTLKDVAGHVKWANARFFRDDVARTCADVLRYNNGKGATDFDLYDRSLAEKYRRGDEDVIRDAKKCLEDNRDPSAVIHTRAELHFFCASGEWRWVDVTKVPWLDDGKKEIKGVQVYFHDNHATLCRQGMIGRWIRSHIPRAITALASNAEGNKHLQQLRFINLEFNIVHWLKEIISNERLELNGTGFPLKSVNWLEPVLNLIYSDVSAAFASENGDHIVDGDFRILEAIILVLFINAYEASKSQTFETNRFAFDGTIAEHTKKRIVVETSVLDGRLTIKVRDKGTGFTREEERQINQGEKLSRDEKPGSGLYLARYLASAFGGELTVKSPGPGEGATAEFRCDLSEFKARCSRRFLGPVTREPHGEGI